MTPTLRSLSSADEASVRLFRASEVDSETDLDRLGSSPVVSGDQRLRFGLSTVKFALFPLLIRVCLLAGAIDSSP